MVLFGGAVVLAACGVDPAVEAAATEQALAAAPAAERAQLQSQLAEARRATARYHDVAVALADGYAPTADCVEVPGLGAMGLHYVNFGLFAAPPRVEQPAILLYLPQPDGGVRLVGVEYAQVIFVDGAPYFGCGVDDETCPPTDPPPAPAIFGSVPFDGPMAGHAPQMPWHYDQHVWVWSHNPSGMFAQFNPSLSCS